MADDAPINWDDVLAIQAIVDDDGPPPFQVADEEARLRSLAPCDLAPASREGLMPVPLRPYAATLWLPDPAAAEDQEVPDETWQGWEWPTGEALLLYAHRDPELPGLRALTVPSPEVCCLEIAGRPMRVRRLAPGHAHWRGEGHVAEVAGFLDDRTSFWAQVRAPSCEQCEQLLAALATLTLAEPPGATERADGG